MWFDPYVLAALGFSCALPLALIATRKELRAVRSSIIDDLKETVFKDHGDLPQLELAAARYRGRIHTTGAENRQDAVMVWTGAFFFALMSWAGFSLLLTPIAWLIHQRPIFPSITPSILWTSLALNGESVPSDESLTETATIAGFSFLGGYVVQIQYLTRATLNQELSALAFVRAAFRLVVGVIMGIVVFRTMGTAMGERVSGSPLPFGFSLAVAFVIGFQPDLGLAKIMKWARTWTKSVDTAALANAKIVPLEVIDGIDSDVSFRLQESALYDVQALATVNPLALYAETPYTLYQAFDWVLQAQLCLVLGTRSFVFLKQHNIRTIFDLERAVLAEGAPADYVCGIGEALLQTASPAFKARLVATNIPGAPVCSVSVDVARHMVAIMGDDLHVHRLRALWNTILHTTAGTVDGQPHWLFATGPLPGETDQAAPALIAEAEAATILAGTLGAAYTAVANSQPVDSGRLASLRNQCLYAAGEAIQLDPAAKERLRLLWNPGYIRKGPTEKSLEPFFSDLDFKQLLG